MQRLIFLILYIGSVYTAYKESTIENLIYSTACAIFLFVANIQHITKKSKG